MLPCWTNELPVGVLILLGLASGLLLLLLLLLILLLVLVLLLLWRACLCFEQAHKGCEALVDVTGAG